MTEPEVKTQEDVSQKELGTVLDLTASFPELIKANKGVEKLATTALGGIKKEEPKKEDTKKTTTEAAIVTDPPDDVEEEEKEEQKSTFFTTKKGFSFKDMNEVNSYLEKTYSVKTPEDYSKFAKSVQGWRNDSQKLSEVNNQLEGVKETLSNLPPVIANAMRSWAEGKDFMEEIRRTAVMPDFTKPAERQDKKLIVNYFYPNKFKEEDFEDFDDNVALKGAYDFAVSTLFPQAKAKVEEQYAEVEKKAERQLQALKQSASSSIDHLNKTFPDVAQQRVRKMEQLMLQGDDSKILALFKNPDGTYRKDTALKLMMAEYGLNDLQQMRTLIDEINEGKVKAVKGAPSTPDTPSNNRPVENNVQDFLKSFIGATDPYKNRPKS